MDVQNSIPLAAVCWSHLTLNLLIPNDVGSDGLVDMHQPDA